MMRGGPFEPIHTIAPIRHKQSRLNMIRILLINPGSTSSELAIFEDGAEVQGTRMIHAFAELTKYQRIVDQLPYRRALIKEQLRKWRIRKGSLSAVVARSPVSLNQIGLESGAYIVSQKMIDDVEAMMAKVEHASGLGCMLAKDIADDFSIPAFISYNRSAVLGPMARISGIPYIERYPVYHVENIEGIKLLAAQDLEKSVDEVNLIIAHLEGGMSIAAINGGQLVDVTSAFEEGPFTTERSGSVPVVALVELCFSARYGREQILKMLRGQGGMVAYLGCNRIGEVERRILDGDEKARFYLEAMCYQIAKDIGSMSTVLKGKLDAIVLTGKILESPHAIKWIEERCSFIAPVKCYPEQEALVIAAAVLKILRGDDIARRYE